MPTFSDGKGGSKFHMNPQMGKHLNGEEQKPRGGEQEADNGDSDLVLSKHGDGSYHTATSNGENRTEHPSLGHAMVHMSNHMEPAKHVHIHSEAGVHHTHKIDESGNHEEHDHQNIDELQQDLGQFFNEEKSEGSGSYGSKKPDGGAHDYSNVSDLMS
jgi:hypothetical protein